MACSERYATLSASTAYTVPSNPRTSVETASAEGERTVQEKKSCERSPTHGLGCYRRRHPRGTVDRLEQGGKTRREGQDDSPRMAERDRLQMSSHFLPLLRP
jgi:hypothetical protein